MDERHIPDPEFVPEWKKATKIRGKKGFVRNFVLKRLQEGRLTDAEIADECATLYDGSTSVKAVQWYKHKFRKEGLLDEVTKFRQRRRYLTEFTYEIIFLQVDPPDNVEVVTAKQLINFAKEIVKKYGRSLPKPVDEIVYDVRTAQYYLKATKRFDVIDQNNYENPFYYKEEDDDDEDNNGEKEKPNV